MSKSPYTCTGEKVDAFDLHIGDMFLDDDTHDDTIYKMVGFDEREWVLAEVIWPLDEAGSKSLFGYKWGGGEAYAPDLYRVKGESCTDSTKTTGKRKPPKQS